MSDQSLIGKLQELIDAPAVGIDGPFKHGRICGLAEALAYAREYLAKGAVSQPPIDLMLIDKLEALIWHAKEGYWDNVERFRAEIIAVIGGSDRKWTIRRMTKAEYDIANAAIAAMGEALTEPKGEETKRNECDCLRRPDSEGMPQVKNLPSPAKDTCEGACTRKAGHGDGGEIPPHQASEILDNDHKFFVKEEFGRFYLVYEGKTLGTSQCVPPIFADEFQRLLKIEWCVKQQGIDLTAKPKPVSVNLELTAAVSAIIGYTSSLKAGEITQEYVDRLNSYYVPNLAKAAGVKYVD